MMLWGREPHESNALYADKKLRDEAAAIHAKRLVAFEYVRARFFWAQAFADVRCGYYDDEFQTLIEQTRELPGDATADYIEWERVNAMWWCAGQRMKRQWEAGQR